MRYSLSSLPEINSLREPTILENVNHESMDEVSLEIRKLLWGMVQLEEIEWGEALPSQALHMYKLALIDSVEIRALISMVKSKIPFTANEKVEIADFFVDENTRFDDWVSRTKEMLYFFSFDFPSISVFVSFYEARYTEVQNHEDLQQLDFLLHMIEDWENQNTATVPTSKLYKMLPWASWDTIHKITNAIIERFREGAEFSTWEELEKAMKDAGEVVSEYPPSFNVIGEKISTTPQRVVPQEIPAMIPQKDLMSWMPKYVYSKPETQERVKFHFPGGENIGHSAILMKTANGLILMDFGMSVINNRIPKWLPILDKVDVVLISHAHLDHSGALPILLRNTGPLAKTPWFATDHTRIMTEMLFNDTAKLLKARWSEESLSQNPVARNLTDTSNIINTLSNFRKIELGKTFSVLPNVEITAHGASHLFGSVGFDINVGGKKIFYTGDFKLEQTKLFPGANFPVEDSDLVLFDGTNYGRYEETLSGVSLERVMEDSKRILIPAFAMGRTQEMLYHTLSTSKYKDWKIIVAGMGGRLIKSLNLNLKGARIEVAPTIIPEEFRENTILIAGNGMLQGGTARDILDETRNDPETTIAFCGYQSPSTMGYHLLNGHPYLRANYKQRIVKLSVSGHSKADSLDSFLQTDMKRKVIVHSPEGARDRLSADILRPQQIMSEEI